MKITKCDKCKTEVSEYYWIDCFLVNESAADKITGANMSYQLCRECFPIEKVLNS